MRTAKAQIRLRIQGLRCPLTKSVDVKDYIDNYKGARRDSADVQDGFGISCSYMPQRPFFIWRGAHVIKTLHLVFGLANIVPNSAHNAQVNFYLHLLFSLTFITEPGTEKPAECPMLTVKI